MVQFPLGVAHSVGVDTRAVTQIHHSRVTHSSFIRTKAMTAPLPALLFAAKVKAGLFELV